MTDIEQNERFRPPFYLRNSMLQTFLGSNRPVTSLTGPLLTAARPVVLQCDDGVRLAGAFSAVPADRAKGLVIFLHGWEGSIASAYVTATGQHLFRCGYHIFRLNLRDHGDTHHLNRGLFYATLFDEVSSAVRQAARMAEKLPVYLCGFSLGGNFALRIACRWQGASTGIDLRQIAAISPVLDPAKATDAIDRRLLIRRYFRRKWQRSLRKKQQLFPENYDFSDISALVGIRQMTDKLLERYSPYADAVEYFAGYTLQRRDFETIDVPTTIITARDDPIIPVADFDALPPGRYLRKIIHSYGGHNGFIYNLRGRAWYEAYLQQIFDASAAQDDGR